MKTHKIFEARKATLIRKAAQLSSRCDASVCVLCFGPDGTFDHWPPDPAAAASVISSYRSATCRGSKSKYRENLGLSNALDAKITVLRRQVDGRNISFDLPAWEEKLAVLPDESLLALSGCLESKVRAIDARIKTLSAEAATEMQDSSSFHG